MPIVTLRLDDDLLDELDEEAEAFGYSSRSHYLRYLLKNRTLPGSDHTTTREKLEEIGAKLDLLLDIEPDEEDDVEDVPVLLRRQRAAQRYLEDGLDDQLSNHGFGPDEETIERIREVQDRFEGEN